MKSGQECYKCGQQGHIARFCNGRSDKYYEKSRTCYICHQHGHLAYECNENSSRPIQCFRCQDFGHIARDCTTVVHHFQRKDPKNSAENYQSSSGSTKTKCRPVNSSYTTAASQRIYRTTAMSSTQNRKGTLTKQKNDINVACSPVTGSNKKTNLEMLANELLFSLFGYLSTVHLLCAFHGLNSRFETLLFAHFRSCHLDFRSVSKYNFKTICRRYLPLIMDRIISLRVSDDNHSANQTNLLSSYGIVLRQFNNLRSLSLCHIRSKQVMNQMMIEWSHLHNLTHLKLIKCHSSFAQIGATHLSNTIWSLSKLTHCYMDTEQYVFSTPTMVSLSLEYVSIIGHCCRLNELTQLLKKTPHLRSLSIRHRDLNDNQYLSLPISSITTLKLYDIHSRPVMMNLLQTMINLSHLRIETFYINLDGYQWEHIIIHHLPNLTVFQLKMVIQFIGKENNEQQVDILLDSFRTPFWIETHQWFVRCHRRPQHNYSDTLLYTLPLLFRNLDKNIMRFPYKSTRPYKKNY